MRSERCFGIVYEVPIWLLMPLLTNSAMVLNLMLSYDE